MFIKFKLDSASHSLKEIQVSYEKIIFICKDDEDRMLIRIDGNDEFYLDGFKTTTSVVNYINKSLHDEKFTDKLNKVIE